MTTWLVSTQHGANTNGGTSQSILAQGTNGVTVVPSNTLVDATANAFTVGMVGQGINIVVSGVNKLRTITGYTSASTITYSGADLGANTGLTWYVGGMWETVANSLVNANSVAAGDNIFLGSGVYRETVAVAYSGAATATGTHGVTSNGGSTFTDATAAAFTSGMVGMNIEITAGGSTYLCKITAYSSSTVVTIAPLTAIGFPTGAYSSCTWIVGKIAVVGDVDGANTGDAGQVTLTAYTTNDKTAPSSSILISPGATSGYLAFSHLTTIAGSSRIFNNTAGGVYFSFLDCTFNTTSVVAAVVPLAFNSPTTGVAFGITIDRCVGVGSAVSNGIIDISLAETSSGSADYDALCVVRNCLLICTSNTCAGVVVLGTGATTHKGGGVRVFNCTIIASAGFVVNSANVSASVACEIHDSVLLCSGTGINAASSGQITEDHNLICAPTARTNVTAGTGSISNGSYASLVELGQSAKWGAGLIRPFLAPDGVNSPLLGFGSDGSANDPVVDILGRPRPAGGGSSSYAVGAYEFHDASAQDTVTYPSTYTSSGKLTGPGDQVLKIPVDAVSSTISLQLYQGSGYTGTNYAQAILLAEGELGVAAQVETCTSTLSAWQTLTFSAITPSKAGYVRILIVSYDTSGTGTLNFGAIGVS